jgi:hypothetical protein
MGSLTFGTDSAKDKYREFLIEYADYKDDETSAKKACDLATTSWHLIDWAFEDYKSIHNLHSIGEFRETLYPSCPSLKIMHDLANASKHKNLDRPKANLKNTERQIGAFSREFSKEFDTTHLGIELMDGTKLDFEEEIDKVKIFWDNFFINL